MNYFIAAETVSIGPMTDLVKALQTAFDNGADGSFKVLVTHAPSYMVIFERSAVNDKEYVGKRAEQNISIETSAMQQLAAELEEGGAGAVAAGIMDTLRNGDAQCFDFDSGAILSMALDDSVIEPTRS